jgi:hypothetical protein
VVTRDHQVVELYQEASTGAWVLDVVQIDRRYAGGTSAKTSPLHLCAPCETAHWRKKDPGQVPQGSTPWRTLHPDGVLLAGQLVTPKKSKELVASATPLRLNCSAPFDGPPGGERGVPVRVELEGEMLASVRGLATAARQIHEVGDGGVGPAAHR